MSGIFCGSRRAQRFQARMLGLFYEDLLVPCLEASGFEVLAGKRETIDSADVPRPVIYINGERRIFDYLLARDGRVLVAESKCWPLYETGSATASPQYVNRQRELKLFLSFDVDKAQCLVAGKETHVDGKALLWWQVTPEESEYWRNRGIEALSIEALLNAGKQLPFFRNWTETYRNWCNSLFSALLDN